jgi:hypothetical protein
MLVAWRRIARHLMLNAPRGERRRGALEVAYTDGSTATVNLEL